jgi:hypothetical protein
MRYMLLIGSDDTMQDQVPPPKAQMDAMIQGHMRFGDELRAKGKMVAADRLRPGRRGQPRPLQGRSAPCHGRALRRDQGGPGRLLPDRE